MVSQGTYVLWIPLSRRICNSHEWPRPRDNTQLLRESVRVCLFLTAWGKPFTIEELHRQRSWYCDGYQPSCKDFAWRKERREKELREKSSSGLRRVKKDREAGRGRRETAGHRRVTVHAVICMKMFQWRLIPLGPPSPVTISLQPHKKSIKQTAC